MKRILLFSAFVMISMGSMAKTFVLSDDSVRVIDVDNKRVVVTENPNKQRIEVEVYELQESDAGDPYEKIFVGHYRDGKVSEQRRNLVSFDIPSPLHKRERKRLLQTVDPHYQGFGIGFADFADRGDVNKIPLRSGKSLEFNLNFLEQSIPLSRRYKWSVVTGVGMRWTRYHLKGNHYFDEIDDFTQVITATNNWSVSKSRLGITTLNLPLLLEWQNRNGKLFFSAGAECAFKTASSSRIWYKDEKGNKQAEKIDAGMTLRPVTVNFLAQAGSGDLGVFARYSPISIFEKDKGYELYPLTFGVLLYF